MQEFNAKKFLIKTTISVFSLALITLVFFQSKEFLEGPTITINNLKNGSSFSESLLNLEGVAKRVSFITLNDRQIFVDESGNLKEKILLQEGTNIISFKAVDRFGRKIETRLEIFHKKG